MQGSPREEDQITPVVLLPPPLGIERGHRHPLRPGRAILAGPQFDVQIGPKGKVGLPAGADGHEGEVGLKDRRGVDACGLPLGQQELGILLADQIEPLGVTIGEIEARRLAQGPRHDARRDGGRGGGWPGGDRRAVQGGRADEGVVPIVEVEAVGVLTRR